MYLRRLLARRCSRTIVLLISWTTWVSIFFTVIIYFAIGQTGAQRFITPRDRLSCTGDSHCTLEPPVDQLDFILVGDLGGMPIYPYVSYAQTKVAQSMAQLSAQEKVKFVVNVGDNIYFNGVQDVYDSRFETSFENVYSHPELLVPWFTLAGNHDHLGNISAQIDYTNYSSRWTYPELYYKASYHFGTNEEITVDLIMIDTIVLCGNTIDIQGSSILDWIFAKHKSPDRPEDVADANMQIDWLEKQLSISNASYLFVVGHYPIYSISEHGPVQCLIDTLDPLLRKYNVTAYFSGHDHNLQHFRVEKENDGVMNYIVSGAGSRSDRSIKNMNNVPKDSLQFRYPTGWNPFSQIGLSNGAFIHVELRKEQAEFTFYNGALEEKYKMSLFPRTRTI